MSYRGYQEQVDSYFDSRSSYWAEIYNTQSVEGVIYQQRMAAVLEWIDDLTLPWESRILEVGGIIGRPAHFTDIAVLVRGPAGGIRAGATDEAIGQKTAVLLAIVLRHGTCDNMPLLA